MRTRSHGGAMGKEVAHSAAIQRSFRTAGSLAADQLAGSSHCALLSLAVAVSAILSYASLDRPSPIAEEKKGRRTSGANLHDLAIPAAAAPLVRRWQKAGKIGYSHSFAHHVSCVCDLITTRLIHETHFEYHYYGR